MKRFADVAISAVALLAFSPVFLVVALLVRVNLGSPVLFRQKRPGLHGAIFEIVKFRTMRDEVDVNGHPVSDDLRLTKFGRFLRSTSLDELPELFNIIRGEMSLVGPRPLLPDYLTLYDRRQASRHDVRPGLTGWAQVNGRNAISWDDKLELDAWYVENRSPALDLKILYLTITSVIKRSGVNTEGTATTTRFAGSFDAGEGVIDLRETEEVEQLILLDNDVESFTRNS